MNKEDDTLWRLVLAVAFGFVFLLSVCAPKADAAPLMSSASTRHHVPASRLDSFSGFSS